MKVAEMSQVERKTLLRAPRERVWKALTDVAEFSKWFGVETEGVFAPGASLQMTCTTEGCGEGGQGVKFQMTIEKMEPPHTFSWRWHPGMPEPGLDYSKEPTTLVVFQLKEVPGGTELTVVESGFDRLSLARRARVFAENDKGWEIQLASIGRFLDASAQR
jgi:uncharacterized protein YndB with AHSA1/START domain